MTNDRNRTLLTSSAMVDEKWYEPRPSPYQLPDWEKVLQYPRYPLSVLVMLSLNFVSREFDAEARADFSSRMDVAEAHIGPGGLLADAVLVHSKNPRLCEVGINDFAMLTEHCKWDVPAEFPRYSRPDEATQEPAIEELGRNKLRQQEMSIIEEIRNQGLDPLNLPANVPGKAGAKSACRHALKPSLLFSGATTFEKTWERLAESSEIRYRR